MGPKEPHKRTLKNCFMQIRLIWWFFCLDHNTVHLITLTIIEANYLKCHLKVNMIWVPERRRYKTSVTARPRFTDFRSKSQSWFISVGFKDYRFALIDKQSLKRIRRACGSVTLGTAAKDWMEIRFSFYLFAPYGWLSRNRLRSARKARDGRTSTIVGTVEAHRSSVWCQTTHSTVHVALFPSCWCIKV
jgi:hypothetical protein